MPNPIFTHTHTTTITTHELLATDTGATLSTQMQSRSPGKAARTPRASTTTPSLFGIAVGLLVLRLPRTTSKGTNGRTPHTRFRPSGAFPTTVPSPSASQRPSRMLNVYCLTFRVRLCQQVLTSTLPHANVSPAANSTRHTLTPEKKPFRLMERHMTVESGAGNDDFEVLPPHYH